MTDDLAALFAKRFIERRDVKAVQTPSGIYMPVTDHNTGARLPWQMSDLRDHLSGRTTYGHYLLGEGDTCRLFALDIDLEKSGEWLNYPRPTPEQWQNIPDDWDPVPTQHAYNPRESWRDRAHPSRDWTKFKMRSLAERLSSVIQGELGLPTAVAYSGYKGLHVYGFTGSVPASQAHEAAELTLALAGGFKAYRGKHFFKSIDQSPQRGYPGLSVEMFPKQSSLDGKDLGNLMRLPLGRNQKSNDPTFFVDQRAPLGTLVPHPDPVSLLQSGRPWL